MVSADAKRACEKGQLKEVLFADDALLIGANGSHVEEYMTAVTHCGKHYGLQVHWGKVHLVPVCTEQNVRNPSGDRMIAQDSLVHLGSTIHNNGHFGCEVSRKIGISTAAYKSLEIVWKHALVPGGRKIALFDSLIQSKLRYAVASARLVVKSELRCLDGFQACCLREILKIPASFYSHVSNDEVLQRSGVEKLSIVVRGLQLKLLDRVLTDPRKTVLKDIASLSGSMLPVTGASVGRRGRPRQNWIEQLLNIRASK